MKKLIFRGIILLFFNVYITFLSFFAFWIFLSKRDIIMSSVPLTIALPGVLLQPWILGFLLLPFGVFIAPVGTTLISLIIYSWLDIRGKLEWIKKFINHLRVSKIILLYVLLIILGGIVFYARHIDFPPLHNRMPKGLKYRFNNIQEPILNSRFYYLRGFIDWEYLCQMQISSEKLESVVAEWGLDKLEIEQLPSAFRKMPPYWWKPDSSGSFMIYATKNFPADKRGQDGWHVMVLWEPQNQIAYMWIKDNF